MIPVPKEGSTTTTRPSSKTQGTRTATFFKEIAQLMPLRELSSAYQLVKKIVLQFKDSSSTTDNEVTTAPPGQLGKTDKRSEYFANSQGTSNSIPLQTKTKKETKGKNLSNAREGNHLIRSGKSLEEGCCGTSSSTKRPISEQCIYSEKEGWGQQICEQLEGVKLIYSLTTFQNGEFTVVEDSLAKKRVHVQTRPQGRIFMCPTFSGRPKECDVLMGRNHVPGSMPVLWPCTSLNCFYKIPKDPHGTFQKDTNTYSNLFG